jgi:hypothetical protein
MRTDHTDAEKAQIGMGAGLSGGLLARMMLRTTESDALMLVALAIGLISAAFFCYGVSRLAVSKGRSPAWGLTGFFGYILLNFVLKPKPRVASPIPGYPPPPPPPGYAPTR